MKQIDMRKHPAHKSNLVKKFAGGRAFLNTTVAPSTKERLGNEAVEKGFPSVSEYVRYILRAYWDFLEGGTRSIVDVMT